MTRHSVSLNALVWLFAGTALILGGCCYRVEVTSYQHDRGTPGGDKSWRGDRNGSPANAGVEIFRIDDGDYAFQSHSTITPVPGTQNQSGAVRLHVRSADPAPSPPCDSDVFPNFQVHYEPSEALEPIIVDFQSPPLVEFSSGWMYFFGAAPIGKTRRVRAIGSGTQMLIEIGPAADYVYVLGEATSQVFVYAVAASDPSEPCRTLTVGTYTRVDDRGMCSEPQSYMDGGDRQEFVESVLDKLSDTPW